MPQIIVTTDGTAEGGSAPIMFRERVSVSDFESEHFAAQLVERLGWAVGDADEVDQRSSLDRRSSRSARRRRGRHRPTEFEYDREGSDDRDRDRAPADPTPGAAQRTPRSASAVTTAS